MSTWVETPYLKMIAQRRPRMLAVAVREHHDLVTDAGGFSPGVHDEHVVHCHAGDGIDALGADLIGQLHEAGQVLGIAGRGEGTRDAEQHHPLALEQLVAGEVLRALLRHPLERARGHLLACLDRHVAWLLLGGRANTLARVECKGPADSLPTALGSISP